MVYTTGDSLTWMIEREWADHRIEDALCGRLRLTARQFRRLLDAERISLNKQTVRDGSLPVKQGQAVRIRLLSGSDQDPRPARVSLAPLQIVYEDDHVLVVDKPPGLIMYPGPDDNVDARALSSAVYREFQERGISRMPLPVHRLDRDTSGLVLYAKHDLILPVLDESLRLRDIHRRYIAAVVGRVPSSLIRIDAPIGRDRHLSGRYRVSQSGQPALTRILTNRHAGFASLLELELDTGRTHQIRVHLSHIGHPLIGDLLYGTAHGAIRRQALHAYRLDFIHPYTGERVQVTSELPMDMRNLLEELHLPAAFP